MQVGLDGIRWGKGGAVGWDGGGLRPMCLWDVGRRASHKWWLNECGRTEWGPKPFGTRTHWIPEPIGNPNPLESHNHSEPEPIGDPDPPVTGHHPKSGDAPKVETPQSWEPHLGGALQLGVPTPYKPPEVPLWGLIPHCCFPSLGAPLDAVPAG